MTTYVEQPWPGATSALDGLPLVTILDWHTIYVLGAKLLGDNPEHE